MLKFFVVVLAAMAVSAGPLAAQTLAAQTSTPDASAAPPPSARQIELAKELVERSGVRNLYASAIMPMVRRMMAQQMKGDTPEQKRLAEAAEGAISDAMATLMPKLIDASVTIYAQTYTEEELSGILDFYKSPAGQAMLAKTPILTQKMGLIMLPLIPEMKREVIKDMCDRLSCTPAQRAAADAAANTH